MALSNSKKKWSKKHELFVIENYGHMTAKRIGERLGRSESSVRWKASELGCTGLDRVTASAVYDNTPLPSQETKKPWWRFW